MNFSIAKVLPPCSLLGWLQNLVSLLHKIWIYYTKKGGGVADEGLKADRVNEYYCVCIARLSRGNVDCREYLRKNGKE